MKKIKATLTIVNVVLMAFVASIFILNSCNGTSGNVLAQDTVNKQLCHHAAYRDAHWQESSAVVGQTIHAQFTWSGAFYHPNYGFYATMSIWDPDNVQRASYTEGFQSSGTHMLSITADKAGTWRAYIFVYTGFSSYITDNSYLTVTSQSQPILSCAPSTIHFGIHDQGWTGSSTFEIWNSGVGTLTYTLSESLSWVAVSPVSGSSTGEHDPITVTVVNTGSMSGYYSGYIDISSNGGSGSAVFVDITINPTQAICDADWQGSSAVVGQTIHAQFTWSGAFYHPNYGFYSTMSIWDPDNIQRASYTNSYQSSGTHMLSITADKAGTWRAYIFVYTGFSSYIIDNDFVAVSPNSANSKILING